jgi:hypothetical protein|tara:strand:- start:576 stop:902 length:327 start_codon:yes stop_codon:yes gene_type:complete
MSQELTMTVVDNDLSVVELTEDELNNLSAKDIQQNDWRVLFLADVGDTIDEETIASIKHQAQSQWTGIVYMDKLTLKYLGSAEHSCVAFRYTTASSKPKVGIRFKVKK